MKKEVGREEKLKTTIMSGKIEKPTVLLEHYTYLFFVWERDGVRMVR
jgi:hypothetical protein